MMAKKHLRLENQDVLYGVWYHEDSKGIEVYHDVNDKVKHFTIPWHMLRDSLKRKDK